MHTVICFQQSSRQLKLIRINQLLALLLGTSTWLQLSTACHSQLWDSPNSLVCCYCGLHVLSLLLKALANRWRWACKSSWRAKILACWRVTPVGKLWRLVFDPILNIMLTKAIRALFNDPQASHDTILPMILFGAAASRERSKSVGSMLRFSHTMNKSFAFY